MIIMEKKMEITQVYLVIVYALYRHGNYTSLFGDYLRFV